MEGMHQVTSYNTSSLYLEGEAIPKLKPRRQWLRLGPGIFIAIGYIDPGNWSTDIAGGAYAGYALLSVVFLSGLIAMLLQVMSARLGIATGKDLAQLSSEIWPWFRWPAWISAEIAIIATELAEVIGSAIALKLLFSIPIILGITLTVFDVLLLLMLDQKNTNVIGRTIAFLFIIISCGFAYELTMAQPIMKDVICGFVPSIQIIQNSHLLYLAIGIIGATIMPHNLYLHSNLVLKTTEQKNIQKTARYTTIDTILFLSCAIILNSALIILAASLFNPIHAGVNEITQACHLLPTLLASSIAPVIFAIMLLAAGQSATITGTLAGQVVLNGFIRTQMKPWVRRLLTRGMALSITLITILYLGEQHIANLLVASQVLLSLQLPLAVIPLLLLTSDKNRMGCLVNSTIMKQLGYASLLVIIIANGILLISFF